MKKLLLVGALFVAFPLVAFPASAETLTDYFEGQARVVDNPGGCPKTRNINISIYDTGKVRYRNDDGNLTFGEIEKDSTFTMISAPNNPNRRFEMTAAVGAERKSIVGKFYFSNNQGRCHYTFDLPRK